MFKKYLLAVSGGPDSMAMLNMYKYRTKAVCTVNYHKRETSDYDVSIVKSFCDKHHIKLFIYDVDKKIYKQHKQDNFQDLARKIRYNFFLEKAKELNIKHLMIAHNLNDSLETAYMQFKRNSKALFYGIKQKTKYAWLKVYRPLLCYQKDCLERYCKTKNISYAIDESNNSDLYERNKVRKIIKAWNQDQLERFIKKVKNYNKKHKKLEKLTINKYQQWLKEDCSIDYFKLLNHQVQYYVLYYWLKEHDEKNNSSSKIEAIIDYINSNKNIKKYRLENDKFIIKSNKRLKII